MEQPLRIRPGLRKDSGKVRQAGTDEEERLVLLPCLVARLADGRQLVGLQILHLVDEQRHTAIELDRGVSQIQCKVGEIGLQRTGVGATLGGLQRDADRQGSIGRGDERERLERAQRRSQTVALGALALHLAQRNVE